ncbi:adenylosuccinate synthase [bacterium]|nr:adenylosuccinate synthase [bacterium]
MGAIVTVGCQWGDEGKGKIIDVIAQEADCIVRHQGGNNAGHSLRIGDQDYVLHLIPSGILYPGRRCIIGAGVVLDPLVLWEEITHLRSRGVAVSPENLMISGNASLILSYHRLLDGLDEEARGAARVGTTRRGIGPAYMDKVGRLSLRVFDLIDADRFRERLRPVLQHKNRVLSQVYGHAPVNYDEMLATYLPMGEKLAPFVGDEVPELNAAIDAGKRVLFEGAQGALLDVTYGTYPYVTSSSTGAGGACTGAGVGPTKVEKVLGIAKAYTTRVGEGPFPTEADPATADLIRNAGPIGEFGATTGRPRRCGWFDVPLIRRSVMASGVTHLALTRLDILSEVSIIKVCVGYRLGRHRLEVAPADAALLSQVEPEYEEIPTWGVDLSGITNEADLPSGAREYLRRLEDWVGRPIQMVSVGPGRRQTIIRAESLFS